MSAAANISQLRQQGNLQLYDPYFQQSLDVAGGWIFHCAAAMKMNTSGVGPSLSGRYLDAHAVGLYYTVEDTGLESLDAYKEQLLGGQLYRNGLTSTGGLVSLWINATIRDSGHSWCMHDQCQSIGGIQRRHRRVVEHLWRKFNFYELKANFRAFYPLVEKEWLIFKYNGTLGQFKALDGTVVPICYRAGGINSVRATMVQSRSLHSASQWL